MNVPEHDEKPLTVLSWNINGFTRKKSGVLQYLSHAQADIVFLQETHIGPRQGYPEGSMHVEELQPDYMWAAFTVFRKNSRGVAILFKRDLACEGFCITGDPKGRYLIITCHIWGKQFIFINVYNPTDDKIDFGDFHDLLSKSPPSSFFVLGGDFNTVLEAQFDKTSNIRNRGHKNRLKGLQGFLEHFNLLDVWRYLYPEEKSFTYYDIKGKSRLDYFFIPYEILRKVNDCKIHARPQFSNRQDFISDHAPISIQIQTGDHRWQFDPSLLDIDECVENLSKTITNCTENRLKRKADLWLGLKARLACEAKASKRRRMERADEEQLRLSCFHETRDAMNPPFTLCSEAALQDYLDNLNQSMRYEKLQYTLKAILMEQISKKEVLLATLSLSDGHGPTPDGLPAKLYKTFLTQFVEFLQEFFNQVIIQDFHQCTKHWMKLAFNESFLGNASSPEAPNTASSDHTYSATINRPMACFNADYHIFATILKWRLNSVVGYILNAEERTTYLSVQACMDTLKAVQSSQDTTLVVSLRVDPTSIKWTYLFQRLKKLPTKFRTLLRWLLATEIQEKDGSCCPSRGLKLGCPLTPILVSLSILPFIHSINHKEKCLVGQDEVMRAFVDAQGALVFLTNKPHCLRFLEEQLKDFTTNSGLSIDERNSEVFSAECSEISSGAEKLKNFKRMTDGFHYCGHFMEANLVSNLE